MVVRFLPLAAIQFARARACSIVIGVSTRTASRSPEISVDEIGGHGRSFSPGAKSIAIAGMLGVRNTSRLRDLFRVVLPELEVRLSDCPSIERALSARICQVEAVTRAIPRAFDTNSRLEVIMAFLDCISLLLIYKTTSSLGPSEAIPLKEYPLLSIRPGLCRHQRTVRYP